MNDLVAYSLVKYPYKVLANNNCVSRDQLTWDCTSSRGIINGNTVYVMRNDVVKQLLRKVH
jgi:hypothetical protein